jgi:hypothetical protein
VLPLHAAIRLLAPATTASPSRLRRERTIRRQPRPERKDTPEIRDHHA